MSLADNPPKVGPAARLALLVAGWVCVTLGAVALVLPLIPTTPFLLIAAACFARTSPRFYRWLLANPLFGPFIRNYREKGGITKKQKVISIASMWPMVLVSVVFVPEHVWLKVSVAVLAVGATIYLLSIKTVKD